MSPGSKQQSKELGKLPREGVQNKPMGMAHMGKKCKARGYGGEGM